jgi:HAD superfamily hydrolase (TIGR01450 family)
MIVDRYDAFLLDLDGVVFLGDEAAPGAREALAGLRDADKGLAFVTNNSSRSPRDLAERLVGLGVHAEPAEVETSALTTASALADRGLQTAFVIGESGLREALEERGIEVVGADAPRIDVVVVGWDRAADYAKLKDASNAVQRGAAFVATNDDASLPAPGGERWPGAGALLAAIETTTGARAEVMGKPHAPIFRAALSRAGGGRPLIVGDRIETDIAGAANLGWDSLLVLTGISSAVDAAVVDPPPTYVGQDLSALFDPALG